MPPMEIEIAVAEFDLLYTRRSFISQINSDNEVVVEPRVSGFLVARHYKRYARAQGSVDFRNRRQ